MTTEGSNGTQELINTTEAFIEERREWIGDAIEAITGDRTSSVVESLPLPPQDKDSAWEDTETLNVDEETQEIVRNLAARFGVGSEKDIEITLPSGYINIIEGGLTWKIAAEQRVNSPNTGTYIYCGWPGRSTKQAEHEFEVDRLGLAEDAISSNEYETARLVAKSHPDFVALDQPFVLPFGYDVHNDYALIEEPTGQITQIGTRDGKPVILLRIDDRENPHDILKPIKPDTARIMGLMASLLTACGDSETAIAMTTSNLYAAKSIDTIRIGFDNERSFGIAMYGRETLAEAKGAQVTEPPAFNQIPAVLRVLNQSLNELEEAVENKKRSNQ